MFTGGRITQASARGRFRRKTRPRAETEKLWKIDFERPGRRDRLPHLPCCARVCKVGGAGGFACRANFSHLL